jgi:diadenosine tetraphosphate (Ap4A) HIT family hydrolase
VKRTRRTVNQGAALPDFQLHPQIATDSFAVCELGLSTVRLMRDANYGWLLLVPRVAYANEIADLTPEDRAELMDELVRASRALRETVACDKLNIAALGNVVAQLHIHVIARRHDDPAWPKPVWGAVPPTSYAPGEGEALAAKLAARLK